MLATGFFFLFSNKMSCSSFAFTRGDLENVRSKRLVLATPLPDPHVCLSVCVQRTSIIIYSEACICMVPVEEVCTNHCYFAFWVWWRRTCARTRKFCQARSYDRMLLRLPFQNPLIQKKQVFKLVAWPGWRKRAPGGSVRRERQRNIQPSERVQLPLAAMSFIALASGEKKYTQRKAHPSAISPIQ